VEPDHLSTDTATDPTESSDRSQTDLVTGAFGNTGSAIAELLVGRGRSVHTLTSRAADPTSPLEVHPFSWGHPDETAAAFEGVTTFFNTYWMRMGDGAGGYDVAVDRCIELIDAAEQAGVERIVHLSVAHPSLDSPYPYFRGKARVETRLQQSPIPAAIVRPTLIFGGDSVLLNNLAWILRRLPVFAIAGDGRYRVRPVHVDDVARLCVEAGDRRTVEVIDAVGPDRPTYGELVREVRAAVGGRARIVPAPTPLVLAGSRALGLLVRDDVLDRDELVSTMEGLADTDGPSTGSVSLAAWLAEHGSTLGRSYENERRNRS
jgi:NADH dehydrogenase